jgi:hypothetical protein
MSGVPVMSHSMDNTAIIQVSMSYCVPMEKLPEFIQSVSPWGTMAKLNQAYINNKRVTSRNIHERINRFKSVLIAVDELRHCKIGLLKYHMKYFSSHKTLQRDITTLAILGFLNVTPIRGGKSGNTTIVERTAKPLEDFSFMVDEILAERRFETPSIIKKYSGEGKCKQQQ